MKTITALASQQIQMLGKWIKLPFVHDGGKHVYALYPRVACIERGVVHVTNTCTCMYNVLTSPTCMYYIYM